MLHLHQVVYQHKTLRASALRPPLARILKPQRKVKNLRPFVIANLQKTFNLAVDSQLNFIEKRKHIEVKNLTDVAILRPLKIPRQLPDKILTDVTEYRLFCYWLTLKPIFYSGVILEGEKRKKEIADLLCITKKSLTKYLNLAFDRGLMRENEKGDFIFCSWRKFFDLYSIEYRGGRSFFYFENDFNKPEYLIRTHILKHNTEKQKYTFYRRYFLFTQYENYVEGEIKKSRERPNKAKAIELISMDRFAADFTYRMKKSKAIRKLFRQFCNDPHTLFKALKHAEGKYRNGVNPNYNPLFTLSCKGVARLFERVAVSTGYYWERRLQRLGYLQALPVSISGNAMLCLEGIAGAYGKRGKSGKRWYRIKLTNQLAFKI